MFGLVTRKELIRVFAEELAKKQKKADYWFYAENNQEMSSYVLNHVEEIKALAIKLNIVDSVYHEAYKIYDFRDSGKKDHAWDNVKKAEEAISNSKKKAFVPEEMYIER